MFETLIESQAPNPQRRGGLVASVALHTALIAGALAATASARSREPIDRDPKPTIVFTQSRSTAEPAERPVEGRPRRAGAVGLGGYRRPTIAVRINFVVDSVLRQPIDVDAQRAFPIDTGVAAICLHCVVRHGDDPAGYDTRGSPATVATVDKAAALVTPPRPRYPEMLRRAGVVGRVVVRLVVDTLGRVEPESIAIRESSHALFAQAVETEIPTLRFVPAEAGGRKVRMLLDLPFEFRLHR